MQSRGKRADTCKGGRGESVEDADRFAIAFAPVSTGTAFVTGVEQAAEFFRLWEIGVHFVQQERGLVLVHDAEENWGAHVFGAQWSRDHGGKDIQSGGFGAISIWRKQGEARTKVNRIGRVGGAAAERM